MTQFLSKNSGVDQGSKSKEYWDYQFDDCDMDQNDIIMKLDVEMSIQEKIMN